MDERRLGSRQHGREAHVTHRGPDSVILRGCILGLCALFGYYLIYICHRIDRGNWLAADHTGFGDFPTFYDAGRAVLRHADPYIPEPNGMSYVYPPLFAVLFAPLSKLSPAHAAKVFLLINLAMAIASLLIGAKEMLRRLGATVAAPGICAVALLAGLMAENDLRGELQAMETDVLILLMFTLALHWLDRTPFRAGAALAFAMNIKYLTILTLPYLLLRRRWKAAAGMIGWTIGFGLLPAIALGWKENLRCLQTAIGGLVGWVDRHGPATRAANVHGIADGLSVSITSAIARELKLHHQPQSYSLVIAAGFGLICLLIAWRMYSRRGLRMWCWPDAAGQKSQPFRGLVALEWAAVVIVTLTFSPDTNTRHLSMVALVYTLVAALLLVPRPGIGRGPALISAVIAVVGLILPIPGMYYPFRRAYWHWSVCSWALLAMFALVLWTGLRYVTASREDQAIVNSESSPS
jgi:hypothetical protein